MVARFIPRQIRNYSTPKVPKILWVKNNGNPPTQVTTKGCKNMDDFAKKVREKFGTNCWVALFTSLGKQPLEPWLALKELLKTDLADNTSKKPLFVKFSPIVPDRL